MRVDLRQQQFKRQLLRTLCFLHGFPDMFLYGFRHQVEPVGNILQLLRLIQIDNSIKISLSHLIDSTA